MLRRTDICYLATAYYDALGSNSDMQRSQYLDILLHAYEGPCDNSTNKVQNSRFWFSSYAAPQDVIHPGVLLRCKATSYVLIVCF